MTKSKPPSYIIVAEYGDPNTNLSLKSSFGAFDSKEDAQEFIDEIFKGTNHIVTILPYNDATKCFMSQTFDNKNKVITDISTHKEYKGKE